MALVGAQAALTSASEAQVIRGVALDSVSREPLSNVIVTLLDSAANFLGAVRSSERGRFVLNGHGSGFYALDARSLGFKRLTSPWIPLESSDTVEVTLRIVRAPVTLSPVVVRAERDAILDRSFLGMNFKAMGARILTPSEIESVRGGARDYVDLVQSISPVGYLPKSIDGSAGARCIAWMRTGGCLLVFVDGVRMRDPVQAISVAPPEQVSHVVLIRASEAGVLFGTGSSSGVLMIFTKQYAPPAAR
ncbi:MAG: TonB-dependent receptor [Gemmatimonadaceae bacterium]